MVKTQGIVRFSFFWKSKKETYKIKNSKWVKSFWNSPYKMPRIYCTYFWKCKGLILTSKCGQLMFMFNMLKMSFERYLICIKLISKLVFEWDAFWIFKKWQQYCYFIFDISRNCKKHIFGSRNIKMTKKKSDTDFLKRHSDSVAFRI